MGWVDRHNRYRQGILGLHSIWKTKRWQTRIQLELLGVTLVDSFLACLHLLPKWRDEQDDDQEGSLFWKYVCVLINVRNLSLYLILVLTTVLVVTYVTNSTRNVKERKKEVNIEINSVHSQCLLLIGL